MSLHGDMQVNGQTIGEWSARRTTLDVHQFNRYECKVTLNGETVEFTLSHAYGLGAAVLASEVLAEGGRLLHPRLEGRVP